MFAEQLICLCSTTPGGAAGLFWVAHLPRGSSEFLGVNGAYSSSKGMSATSVFCCALYYPAG